MLELAKRWQRERHIREMGRRRVEQNTRIAEAPIQHFNLQTNMLELAKQWQRERHVHSVGGDEPTLRSEAAPAQRAEMPVSELRPGAPKEQLRPDEHNALPLVEFSKAEEVQDCSSDMPHKCSACHAVRQRSGTGNRLVHRPSRCMRAV